MPASGKNGTSRRSDATARISVRDVTPSASRLTTSLRDIGYDPHTAIADLVDNALDAGAKRITVGIEFAGAASRIIISDNGSGMGPTELDEALRFGSRRTYAATHLGRFGLGLKTASLALGRRLTVLTRAASTTHARTLCLDHIDREDRWEVLARRATRDERQVLDRAGKKGTVIIITSLDRLLNESHPDSGWTRRRLATIAERTRAHLGMVFHRFLDGSAGRRVRIRVDGAELEPWNPFAPDEPQTIALPVQKVQLEAHDQTHVVRFSPFVLPPRTRFSSQEAFDRLSGPRKWNRQQGLYIYRANRMIQSGGWCGLRAADEHTKLARAALDFPTELDELFGVNVAKMRVSLPPQLRKLLEHSILDLSHRADAAYRSSRSGHPSSSAPHETPEPGARSTLRTASLCISLAAQEIGEFEALSRIMKRLRKKEQALAGEMGW